MSPEPDEPSGPPPLSSGDNVPARWVRTIQGVSFGILSVALVLILVCRYAQPLVLRDPIELTSRHEGVVDARAPGTVVQTRIDPNTATWAELTRLPRIGEIKAKRIVAYRTARQDEARQQGLPEAQALVVFRCPQDLAAIRGIGPKTVARMADHLRFEAGPTKDPTASPPLRTPAREHAEDAAPPSRMP